MPAARPCPGARHGAWALRPELVVQGLLLPLLTCAASLGSLLWPNVLGLPSSALSLMLCPLHAFCHTLFNPARPRGVEAQKDSKLEKTEKRTQPYTSTFPEARSGVGDGGSFYYFPRKFCSPISQARPLRPRMLKSAWPQHSEWNWNTSLWLTSLRPQP